MLTFVPASAANAFSPRSVASMARVEAQDRLPVITLCGSTRFMKQFEQANTDLTLQGCVVFSVATKAHEGSGNVSEDQKRLLDRVHLEKIRLSDGIFVINVGGYVGPSTSNEIEFARRLGKSIYYLEDVDVGVSRPR